MTDGSDPWLRAYLDTLEYHEQTVSALKDIEFRLWCLTCAIEAFNNDLQILLARSRGRGLFGGNAKEQAKAVSQQAHKKGFRIE